MASAVGRGWNALPHRPGPLKRCLSMLDGLRSLGWHASAAARQPVDEQGRPVPWYTYPAILWLDPRVPATARVFEYGAGNSTRWYAERVAAVRSVDHDERWVAALRPQVPANVELVHQPTRGDLLEAPDDDPYVTALEDPGAWDVVVIDGRARNACARRTLPALHDHAIAIVDNSDRPGLAPTLELAGALGLRRIDFSGPAPGSGRLGTTTVLGRDLDAWLSPAPALPLLGYEGS